MSIAMLCPDREVSDWLQAFQRQAPELIVEVWPQIRQPEQVEYALCWNQPPGILRRFPNLKCISSLGAGVNHLLQDADLPEEFPLVRLVDNNLRQSMAEYVMHGTLEHCRRFAAYRCQQHQREWSVLQVPASGDVSVGIMGGGELGGYVAEKLAVFGFNVSIWSRSAKALPNVSSYVGQAQLAEFLGRAEVLVCLLPLTTQTENILNGETFALLPRGAYLINVARGGHLVEEEFLAALDDGKLSGALLDVFRDEPLSHDHPFWQHEKIRLTPHIASLTNPESAVAQVVENYRRLQRGEKLLHLVDRQRGY